MTEKLGTLGPMAAIIFDFDGTIADSFDFIANFLAEEAGQSLSQTQLQALRGRSMAAIGRQLGLSWWRLLRSFFRGRRHMAAVINQIEPFEGITEVIKKLHAEGHELFVLSSNKVGNVREFLHHHQLHTYFLEVYGGAGLFSKAPALRKLLKEHQLERADSIYIGDELRDVQAAQSIDLLVIAVTWGFARSSALKALQPTAVANEPADLVRILEEL